MPCEPRFDQTVPVECIRDLISDVRSGAIRVNLNASIAKALWAAGCVNAILTTQQPTILAASKAQAPVFSNTAHAAAALEEYCDTFEKNCAETTDPNLPETECGCPIVRGVKLDPQLIGFILQAIQYILSQLVRSN